MMKPFFFSSLSLLGILLATSITSAHGEDKPGPNGGEIRMPGAFHTEIRQKGREFEVYLLDLSFANPQTADSSVDLNAFKPDSVSAIAIPCRSTRAAQPPHFVCLNPKYKAADGDVLKVKAKRGTSTGNEVEYTVPLLQATKNSTPKNSGKSGKLDAKEAAGAHDHGHGAGHGKVDSESSKNDQKDGHEGHH